MHSTSCRSMPDSPECGRRGAIAFARATFDGVCLPACMTVTSIPYIGSVRPQVRVSVLFIDAVGPATIVMVCDPCPPFLYYGHSTWVVVILLFCQWISPRGYAKLGPTGGSWAYVVASGVKSSTQHLSAGGAT